MPIALLGTVLSNTYQARLAHWEQMRQTAELAMTIPEVRARAPPEREC